jgi:hypothetical protein
MDCLDQDDPATGRGFFFDLGLSTLRPSTLFLQRFALFFAE